MSSDNKIELNDASPERMSEELHKFIDHLKTHKPDALRFAVMLAGTNAEVDGKAGIHSCALVTGNPEDLGQAIGSLLEQTIERFPVLGLVFVLQCLHAMKQAQRKPNAPFRIEELGNSFAGIDLDSTGNEVQAAIVQKLIDQLKKGPKAP